MRAAHPRPRPRAWNVIAMIVLVGWWSPLVQAGPVRTTVVHDAAPEQGIVAFGAGRDQGVAVGDRFWVFEDGGVRSSGSIYYVDDKGSAGRMIQRGAAVSAGDVASILRLSTAVSLRDRLPEGVSMRGRVVRTPPHRRTAWLDLGAGAGLQPTDEVLIERRRIPIARGPVALLEDGFSLVALSPLTANARAEAGDAAVLWPAPGDRRWGRLSSIVMDVRIDGDRTIVQIVGTALDGLVSGRRVDFFRHDRYVAVGRIVDVGDPLTRVELSAPESAMVPEVGDEARVRPPADDPPAPLSVAVFRVDDSDPETGAYGLIAAGETDGIEVGERFLIWRPDPDRAAGRRVIGELVTSTVKISHSGGDIRLLRDGPEARAAVWDMAERARSALPVVAQIGIIIDVEATHGVSTADIDPSINAQVGEVVRLCASPDRGCAAGIVIHRAHDRMMMYHPAGWADPDHLRGAVVEWAALGVDSRQSESSSVRSASP